MKKNIIFALLVIIVISLVTGLPKYLEDAISLKLKGDGDTTFSSSNQNNKNANLNQGNLILVNKDNALSQDYKPKDLVKVNVKFNKNATAEERTMRKEAAAALEKLFKGAENEGIELYGLNGYRSYNTQRTLYNEDCKKKGRAYAEQYDAEPGCSEHQTGLAMDVTNKIYSYNFQTTKEGKWLAKNCYKYGFILRYPQGKEGITGYGYEPWHIRYVGETAAKKMLLDNIVLEQYIKH